MYIFKKNNICKIERRSNCSC